MYKLPKSSLPGCKLLALAMFALLGQMIFGTVSAEVIDGENLIDPTRPLFAQTPANNDATIADLGRNSIAPSYDVTFVRAGSTSPIAVINNQRVTVGDVIGAAQVVGIDRDGVTLRINDEEKRINMFETNIKRPLVER